MSYRTKLTNTLIICCFCIFLGHGQMISRSELNDSIQNFSYFTIHKDNYFISGFPLTNDINSNTADAKYQISFKQMITRDRLPWETYLFITYTQKAFWNIYKDSYPFRDINFNPSLVLGKRFLTKTRNWRVLPQSPLSMSPMDGTVFIQEAGTASLQAILPT